MIIKQTTGLFEKSNVVLLLLSCFLFDLLFQTQKFSPSQMQWEIWPQATLQSKFFSKTREEMTHTHTFSSQPQLALNHSNRKPATTFALSCRGFSAKGKSLISSELKAKTINSQHFLRAHSHKLARFRDSSSYM